MRSLFIIAVIFLCTFEENDAANFICPILNIQDTNENSYQLLPASITCPTPNITYTNCYPYNQFPLPQCPEFLGMNLKVYTRRNPTVGQLITNTSIPPVYNGSLPTMYLVHGWTQNENFTWLADLRDALLAQGDYNVINVGWAKGAADPIYIQASSNTRTAGAWLALVSNFTISHGGSARSRQYCIGASLGAHVCGQAGSVGQFARISGLDPAGPLYETSDISVGLNPSCADLVDIIHTNGALAGTVRVLGHIDFYPNGGLVQPGCNVDTVNGYVGSLDYIFTDPANTIESAQNVSLLCNHIRAQMLFTESVGTPCFLARSKCTEAADIPLYCRSYGNKVVQSMGFEANISPNRGIFYLLTNAFPPYCRG